MSVTASCLRLQPCTFARGAECDYEPMRVYMLRRLLLAVPTVFLVSLIVFFMIRFIPGSAIDAAVVRMGMVGGEVDFSAARAKFEHALGPRCFWSA